MKTFFRRSLPEKITYNKEVYIRDISASQAYAMGNYKELTEIGTKKKMIEVQVLSRNLEERTDLHGKPYKPTRHIFTNQ